jgi:hypothetical protein
MCAWWGLTCTSLLRKPLVSPARATTPRRPAASPPRRAAASCQSTRWAAAEDQPTASGSMRLAWLLPANLKSTNKRRPPQSDRRRPAARAGRGGPQPPQLQQALRPGLGRLPHRVRLPGGRRLLRGDRGGAAGLHAAVRRRLVLQAAGAWGALGAARVAARRSVIASKSTLIK